MEKRTVLNSTSKNRQISIIHIMNDINNVIYKLANIKLSKNQHFKNPIYYHLLLVLFYSHCYQNRFFIHIEKKFNPLLIN